MRIVFAGTPEFAAHILAALLADTAHQVVAVFTQPDRKAGRGQTLQASPVKQLALAHQLPVHQPQSLKASDPAAATYYKALQHYQADIMVVVAYGIILPQAILDIPKLGCVNIHASLLPAWRGAAPIQRALLAGDQVTGITIMQMDQGLDTGDILHQQTLAIAPTHTSATLFNDLQGVAVTALLYSLNHFATVQHNRQPQGAGATYADKLSKAEAQLNWQQNCATITRAVRGYQPWPVAYAMLAGEAIRVWQAHVGTAPSSQSAGTIEMVDKTGVYVACNDGLVQLTALQWPGGKVLDATQIWQAGKLQVGLRFD